jgi:hypothetical protein
MLSFCQTNAAILLAFFASTVFAQESPALSTSPAESLAPPATPEETASPTPARSVRISFVPPPLEGKISLGIYDGKSKLVRVLHQEAGLDQFKIGADALATQWDGKNDKGEDLPPGKYHARGYLVGSLQIVPMNESNAPTDAAQTVRVQLTPNLLANDRRQSVDLAVRLNEKGSLLETADGLPIFTISERQGLTRATMKKSGQNSVEVWTEGGGSVAEFHVSNLDQMMAFDCGEFELKQP